MSNADHEILRQVVEAVRESCIDEARDAFEQGGMSGLCLEGRWALAMDRLRSLDLAPIVRTALLSAEPQPDSARLHAPGIIDDEGQVGRLRRRQ